MGSEMIHFTLFRTPIFIHLSFWVAMLAWGVALTAGEPHPLGVLFFIVAAFICLLVHEFGHAVAGRVITGDEVGVCLSWLGGSCCSRTEPRWTRAQGIFITLAGPIAGLSVAMGVYIGLAVATQSMHTAGEVAGRMLQGQLPMEFADSCPALLLLLFVYMLQISVWWTALNLLPIYPLDGGLLMHGSMGDSHVAHTISLITTCGLSVFFFAIGVWALAGLMIYLSYYNYKCILVHTE